MAEEPRMCDDKPFATLNDGVDLRPAILGHDVGALFAAHSQVQDLHAALPPTDKVEDVLAEVVKLVRMGWRKEQFGGLNVAVGLGQTVNLRYGKVESVEPRTHPKYQTETTVAELGAWHIGRTLRIKAGKTIVVDRLAAVSHEGELIDDSAMYDAVPRYEIGRITSRLRFTSFGGDMLVLRDTKVEVLD